MSRGEMRNSGTTGSTTSWDWCATGEMLGATAAVRLAVERRGLARSAPAERTAP
jgi:hypothetical protein